MTQNHGRGQEGPPVYRNGDAYVAPAFVCVATTEHGDYWEHCYGIFVTSNGARPYERVKATDSLPEAIASCNNYAALRWVEEPCWWKRLFRAGRWELI